MYIYIYRDIYIYIYAVPHAAACCLHLAFL